MPSPDWSQVADRSIAGQEISPEEVLAVIQAPDSETLPILHAAYKVRHHFFGNRVRIHVLLNAKSGACPEDCGFCAQSSIAKAEIDEYKLLSKDEIVSAAYQAKEAHAAVFCVVTATRGPSEREMDTICDAAREIKKNIPGMRLCTSLGILNEAKAKRLKEAGVDRFNHNLETTEDRFSKVCTTHTFQDRVDTVRHVQNAGMVSCCGGIVGMGESDRDVVDLAFTFRRLKVDSIPVNFLDPRPGTPLEPAARPSPQRCLRVLSMFRFVNPDTDLRCAGGREVALRSLQALSLYPANSIFTDGYLTTGGQSISQDHQMIRDMGFEIEESY